MGVDRSLAGNGETPREKRGREARREGQGSKRQSKSITVASKRTKDDCFHFAPALFVSLQEHSASSGEQHT